MKVRTTACESSKTAIVATVAPTPVISFVNDSLVSSIQSGLQWYLNGNAIIGANSNKYKPTESGSYTVATLDNLGCEKVSAPYTFSITAINPVANAEVNLTIAPNPNNGLFTLSFNMAKKEELKVEFINGNGQSVWNKYYGKYQGSFNEQINMTSMSSGIYILKIQHGNKTFFNKVLIQK